MIFALPGLRELRISSKLPSHIPRPKTLSLLIIIIIILGFVIGKIRNELALTLLGAVFLVILAYCFLAVLLLGILNRNRIQSVRADIVTREIRAGAEGELRFSQKEKFFVLPGTLVRYELNLETRDSRKIRYICSPEHNFKKPVHREAGDKNNYFSFPVPFRGAYYGSFDYLYFFDSLGFFSLSFPVPREQEARLLASPAGAEEQIMLPVRSGGIEQRNEIHYRKTDDLTENRPYVPGDDPRRINWKLYSHGPGSELFVRDGENEPPPHSRLLILLDTQTDSDLFNPEEGRLNADCLCEYALGSLSLYKQAGMEILFGFNGGKIMKGEAVTLAWPAAMPFLSEKIEKTRAHSKKKNNEVSGTFLPPAPPDRGIIILALPRSTTGSTALDDFLSKRQSAEEIDLVFLYSNREKRTADWEEAARTCAAFYRHKKGIHTHIIGI